VLRCELAAVCRDLHLALFSSHPYPFLSQRNCVIVATGHVRGHDERVGRCQGDLGGLEAAIEEQQLWKGTGWCEEADWQSSGWTESVSSSPIADCRRSTVHVHECIYTGCIAICGWRASTSTPFRLTPSRRAVVRDFKSLLLLSCTLLVSMQHSQPHLTLNGCLPQAAFVPLQLMTSSTSCTVETSKYDMLTKNLNSKQQPPQPRAWQGPNPITQRASASTPNGTEKAVPKPQSQAQQKNTAESNADKHAHDRALYLIASFTVRMTGLSACSHSGK
jgi:hypothetical protein